MNYITDFLNFIENDAEFFEGHKVSKGDGLAAPLSRLRFFI